MFYEASASPRAGVELQRKTPSCNLIEREDTDVSKFALTSIGREHKSTLPMKHVLLLGVTLIMLAASVPRAEAVVCARGIYRAGCVGPRGAVAVRRPIHHHGCYWRAGVRICR